MWALKGIRTHPYFASRDIFEKYLKQGALSINKPTWERERHVVFELSLDCNLSCRYCFNRYMKRDTFMEPRHWEYIIQHLPQKTVITLFGGEPFLYKGILDVLKAIERHDKDFVVRCFTNGTLSESVASTLAQIKKPINLLVSIDGPKDIHDVVRGKGVYDAAKETLKRVREMAPQHKIIVKSTVSTLNMHRIRELVKDLDGLFDSITFGELHPTGKGAERKEEMEIPLDTWFDIFLNIQSKYQTGDVIDTEVLNRCGFGEDLLYIRSDGYIGGCTEWTGYKHHILEYMMHPERDLWDYIPIKFPNESCLSCPLYWACRGGCRNMARILTGKWDGCDLSRKKWVESTMEYVLKKSNDPAMYDPAFSSTDV